ncbi:MAG: hypothetical protein JWN86_2602 [Planctomycetota bacterium]|nr:hypothetical protein [Planctomycetota bacterium]
MKWPENARKAIGFLFRYYNDIDVYVEDTTSRNMYEILIERMLGGSAQVKRVIQLGGRDKVLAECASDQLPGGRPRLYLVDGDLDLLLGIKPPSLVRFYSLKVYAAENLLVCENSLMEVGFNSLTNQPRNEIADLLDYDRLVEHLAESLIPLFVEYAVASHLIPSQPTCSFNVMNLCENSNGSNQLDVKKVRSHRDSISANLAAEVDEDLVSGLRLEIQARLGPKKEAFLKFVSGKTYILPLVEQHLKRTVRFRGTREQLKTQLARHTDLNVDGGLLASVISCSRDRF